LISALNATSTNSALLAGGSAGAFTLPQLTAIENSALSAQVFAQLQTTVIPTINGTLGLSLGGADVGAHEMHCNRRSIVK
jgi:hypothetical protein